MKKDSLLIGGVALLAGLIIGYLIGHGGGTPERRASAPPQRPAPAATVTPQKQIDEIKSVVAQDPSNRGAWVALGNTYFDNNQFIDAIDAYDKALELGPDDANVLTDQGVMFRRLGWFDKAIENFRKATEIAPNNPTPWFNLGVVYRNDLKDFPKAIEAWNRFLELAPAGPNTEQIRQQIEAMKNHPPMPQGQGLQ
ncbi:MAG TPA: tetratricopeptide repeat protein [Desulfuromonadales bacterium]|nr:tetratricopeptide repeat protein [Desulfuromonadales bacterium]